MCIRDRYQRRVHGDRALNLQKNTSRNMNAVVKNTFRRVRVAEFGKPLIVEEVPTPQLQPNELLVKVAASPLNPSDIYASKGKGSNKNPFPGLEGSGTVIKTGDSERAIAFLGKRVATLNNIGNWAEYTVASVDNAYEVNPAADLKKAACSCINPLTVVGMRRIVRRGNHKAIIHTAGASVLGKILIQTMKEEGIQSINVVRKQEQIDELQKEFPYARFLNSSTPDFKEQLGKLAAELSATVAFDCIGGSMTGLVITVMPPKSSVYNYGRLSGEPVGGIPSEELMFKNKSIHGLWLNTFLEDPEFCAEVPKAIYEMPSYMQSDIQKEFSLEQVNEAIEFASANAGKGKVILNPDLTVQYVYNSQRDISFHGF
eukprot:TRINITY_DN2067_c0_g1_i1.p1 TRINITY_DN2067_c0_g1~~TRINITY_DN2067_c0_g1_i1.p1  ORF type:complete len:372 (-),score=114.19 TRINITY_DN2067_c0_g1_i1:1182-2297(-)